MSDDKKPAVVPAEEERDLKEMPLIERQAILSAELSLRACQEIHEKDDGEIDWNLVARLANASADCTIATLSLRQDRDIRMQRMQAQFQAREAKWQEIAKCPHLVEGGISAFEITKDRGAVCRVCNVSHSELKERERELEARAQAEDAQAKKMEEAAAKKGGGDEPGK